MKRIDKIFASFMRATPVKPVREWYVNWMIDGKTRATTAMPPGPYAELGKIEVPFVVVQNLGNFSLHQFGAYDLFENAGTPAGAKWLILGQAEMKLPVYAWQLEAHRLLRPRPGQGRQRLRRSTAASATGSTATSAMSAPTASRSPAASPCASTSLPAAPIGQPTP